MACKMDGRSTVELLFELRRVSNELALIYNSSSAKGSNGVFFFVNADEIPSLKIYLNDKVNG